MECVYAGYTKFYHLFLVVPSITSMTSISRLVCVLSFPLMICLQLEKHAFGESQSGNCASQFLFTQKVFGNHVPWKVFKSFFHFTSYHGVQQSNELQQFYIVAEDEAVFEGKREENTSQTLPFHGVPLLHSHSVPFVLRCPVKSLCSTSPTILGSFVLSKKFDGGIKYLIK